MSSYEAPKQAWPTPQDYNEAIQNPAISFGDDDLRRATAEQDRLGLPKAIAGNFASVYKMESGGSTYAVRCFSRNVPDQNERYAAISEHLDRVSLPQAVGFKFVRDGLRVRGRWYPILKMEWIKGATLASYVDRNCSTPSAMDALIAAFRVLIEDLRRREIAHGDLQHGNLLVTSESRGLAIRLIDYDGMWVPALKDRDAVEVGHPNYQHPLRSVKHHDRTLDSFSEWVILSSLLAVRQDPAVWHNLRARKADDCLLFTKADFAAPGNSRTFKALASAKDPEVQRAVETLRSLCLPSKKVLGLPAPNGVESGDALDWIPKPTWWDSFLGGVRRGGGRQPVIPPPPPAATGGDWWRSNPGGPMPPTVTTSGPDKTPRGDDLALDRAAKAVVHVLQRQGGTAGENQLHWSASRVQTLPRIREYLERLGLVYIDPTDNPSTPLWILQRWGRECVQCKGPLNPFSADSCLGCGARLPDRIEATGPGSQATGVQPPPPWISTPKPAGASTPAAPMPLAAAPTSPITPAGSPVRPPATAPTQPQVDLALDRAAKAVVRVLQDQGGTVQERGLPGSAYPGQALRIREYLERLGLVRVDPATSLWTLRRFGRECTHCSAPLNPYGAGHCRGCGSKLRAWTIAPYGASQPTTVGPPAWIRPPDPPTASIPAAPTPPAAAQPSTSSVAPSARRAAQRSPQPHVDLALDRAAKAVVRILQFQGGAASEGQLYFSASPEQPMPRIGEYLRRLNLVTFDPASKTSASRWTLRRWGRECTKCDAPLNPYEADSCLGCRALLPLRMQITSPGPQTTGAQPPASISTPTSPRRGAQAAPSPPATAQPTTSPVAPSARRPTSGSARPDADRELDLAAKVVVRILQAQGGTASEGQLHWPVSAEQTMPRIGEYLKRLHLVTFEPAIGASDSRWTLRRWGRECAKCPAPLNPYEAVSCLGCGSPLSDRIPATSPGRATAGVQAPPSSMSAAKPPGLGMGSRSSLDTDAREALAASRRRGNVLRRSELRLIFTRDQVESYLTGLGLLEIKDGVWHTTPRETGCDRCKGPLNPVGATTCVTCGGPLPA